MDSLAMRFYRRLRSIAKLFRFIELFVVLTFVLWLSTQLPFAVKISGHYCRRFSAIILSPISIFLLGNAIVLALLTKSGLFSGEASATIDIAVADLYEELRSGNSDDDAIPVLDEEIVFQDKEIICEENTKIAISNAISGNDHDYDQNVPDFSDEKNKPEMVKTSYRRSQSENLRRESEDKSSQKLRRSETDIRRKDLAGGETPAKELPEDDMSNEEFQRTIEDFIAKQIRFHRQEGLAVVLHGQA